MRKITILILLSVGWIYSPVSIYAGGKCELTIENNTGAHITQIILDEKGSKKGPETFYRSMAQNDSTTIKIKKGTLYDLVLVNTDERQFVKRRQAWDDEEGSISFHPKDIQDRHLGDKLIRIVLWPKYL